MLNTKGRSKNIYPSTLDIGHATLFAAKPGSYKHTHVYHRR
jgi:hypothetical protein